MYSRADVMEYHKKYWGEDFHRDDFIPLLKGTKFNAEDFAKQCKNWGAKYVIPFATHMDGYCIWNNSYSHRDAVDMPPYKDLLGEMYAALRNQGLKTGFYNCNYDFEYPILNDNKIILRNAKAANDPKDDMTGYIPFDSKKKHNRMISGKIPVKNYISDYYVPYMKEVVDKYFPDIRWYDAEWFNTTKNNANDLITAYCYNKNDGVKEVAVNDRLGSDSREKHGDFYTSEFHVIHRKPRPLLGRIPTSGRLVWLLLEGQRLFHALSFRTHKNAGTYSGSQRKPHTYGVPRR